MKDFEVRLLKHTQRVEIDRYLRLYRRCFNADERVRASVLRRIIQPSPSRVNPVHLFAAYQEGRLVGGACTLVLPVFQVVFGSYLFVDPALRHHGVGVKILREVLRQEKKGPRGRNWRGYLEVTAASGTGWHKALAGQNFRFFKARWPIGSYREPGKVIYGRLGYFDLRKPPSHFSQPALLAYIHALFYGPELTHRFLLPRLKHFIKLDA